MDLITFINATPNWEEILSRPPYSLKITHDGPYIMLKYQQFISDMGITICQQARGAIFRKNGDYYAPISIAMYKFFNAAEKYAATEKLDWNTATIMEKIDGSLMRLSYDGVADRWLLSSNGAIYARNVITADGNNFEDIFISILGGKDAYARLLAKLNPIYCYFFEMISPHNRICVKYNQPAIYFLGRRNMANLKEDNEKLEFDNIQYPREYKLYSLSDCISAACKFENDFEGFVVKDANFNRIKIKTPWYIAMHKMRGNGIITVKRIIEMWRNDTLDDFVAFYPEYQNFVESVMKSISRLISVSDIAYLTISRFEDIQSRADFAAKAKDYIPTIQAFLFARLDKKCTSAAQFFKNYRLTNLINYVSSNITTTQVGVMEDE